VHPSFLSTQTRRQPLTRYRPDLPAWLDAVLARAVTVETGKRSGDAMELAFELESGLARGAQIVLRKQSLYERNPVRFWQVVSALLALGLIAALSLM